jgi:hypothetical protein
MKGYSDYAHLALPNHARSSIFDRTSSAAYGFRRAAGAGDAALDV